MKEAESSLVGNAENVCREVVTIDAGGTGGKVVRMAMIKRSTRSRRSRSQKFRRSVSASALWLIAAMVIFGAFATGYLWRQNKVHPENVSEGTAKNVDEAQRMEAMALIDEAVRARHEERWQGAMNALREARRFEPTVRGVDVLLGEISVEQKDARTLLQAAREALRRGENESSAYLLLALESWMQRGETGTAKAGDAAKQHLADAAERESSNASVYFFLGELNRLLGESGAALTSLSGALSRQEPWDSSALLGVKMQLAAFEASEADKTISVPLADGQAEAVLALRSALRDTSEVGPAIRNMLAVMPSLQAAELLEDAGFSSVRSNQHVEAGLRQAAAWPLRRGGQLGDP